MKELKTPTHIEHYWLNSAHSLSNNQTMPTRLEARPLVEVFKLIEFNKSTLKSCLSESSQETTFCKFLKRQVGFQVPFFL